MGNRNRVIQRIGFGLHIGGTLIFLLLLLAIIGVVFTLAAGGMYGASRHHHYATEVTEVEHREV